MSTSSQQGDTDNDYGLTLISNIRKRDGGAISGLGRDYWLDDSSATKCRSCERKFTTFRRRHHCRICGKIFCGNCTTFIDGQKFNYNGNMRVCLTCLKLANRLEDYISSEDESIIDDGSSIFKGASQSILPSPVKTDTDSIISESNASSLHPTTTLERKEAPTPPPMMAIAATRKGESVEIDVGRSTLLNNRRNRASGIGGKHRPQPSFSEQQFTGKTNLFNNNIMSGVSNSNSIYPSFKSPDTNNDESNKFLQPLNFGAAAAAASGIFNFGVTGFQNMDSSSSDLQKISKTPSTSRSTPTPHNQHHNTTSYNHLPRNSEPKSSFNSNTIGTALPSPMFPSYPSTYNDEIMNPRKLSLADAGSESSAPFESDSDDSADSENEQTMMVFPNSSNFQFDNNPSSSRIISSTSANLRFSDNGRRPVRNNRNRRTTLFKRIRSRRMSKSGSKYESQGTKTADSMRTVSQPFGFGNQAPIEFLDDFLRAGEKHSKHFLRQLLEDKSVEHIDEWENVLIPCIKKVSEVSKSIATGQSFDISNYLKIKIIPGAFISNTHIIEGLVFSKLLASKRMPRKIINPRILLISFPLEYEEDSMARFSSIEPVIEQQEEYLKKWVARIVALGPSVVLVSASVNGIAIRLLADEGIAVAHNVKPQILEKLSTLTQADIINSIDRLAMKPKLGTCQSFEVKSYAFGDIARTYFFFEGCKQEIGYTLVLRGGSKEVLQNIKNSIILLVYAYLNTKLESGLMRDQCLQAKDYKPNDAIIPLTRALVNNYDDFYNIANHRILSCSPWVKFEVPYLIEKLKGLQEKLNENDHVYAQFQEDYDRIMNFVTPIAVSESERSDQEITDEKKLVEDEPSHELVQDQYRPNPELLIKYLNYYNIKIGIEGLPKGYDDLIKIINSAKLYKDDILKSEILYGERQWENFWSSKGYFFFNPNSHQNIVTLFSMVSTKNATPCIGPEIQVTEYYWDSDFSLGQYIEHICLHADDKCNEGCGLTLKDHFRSYVHGSGKVDVVVENSPYAAVGRENLIMSWSYCKICHSNTAILPMSDNAWKFSFGKYLELSFWCRDMKVKGANCPHDFYRDQIHYFSFQNLAMRVEYSDIETLELVPPKFQIFFKPEKDIKIKIDTYQSIKKKSEEFFDSVKSRLNRIKIDSMTSEKVEAAQKKIKELKEKVEIERTEINGLTDDIYISTSATDHLRLNAVLRAVQELSGEWNFEFQEFDKNFLPTEKEIKRITTFQLDKLFKATTELTTKASNLPHSPKEEKLDEKAADVENENKDKDRVQITDEGLLFTSSNKALTSVPSDSDEAHTASTPAETTAIFATAGMNESGDSLKANIPKASKHWNVFVNDHDFRNFGEYRGTPHKSANIPQDELQADKDSRRVFSDQNFTNNSSLGLLVSDLHASLDNTNRSRVNSPMKKNESDNAFSETEVGTFNKNSPLKKSISESTLNLSSNSKTQPDKYRGSLVLQKISQFENKDNVPLLSSGNKVSSFSTSPVKNFTAFSQFQMSNDQTPVVEKKNQWETGNDKLHEHLLRNNGTVLPKLSGLNNEGTVRKLTEFFDAQEFFKHREREKAKLQAATNYKPKVLVSRPTVEVYKSVRDAVDAETNKNQTTDEGDFSVSSDDELESSVNADINHQYDNRKRTGAILNKQRDASFADPGKSSENSSITRTCDTSQEDHSELKKINNNNGENARNQDDLLDEQSADSKSSKPPQSLSHKETEKVETEESSAEKEEEEEVQRQPIVSIPEKSSLFRSLAHFWADRSATLWEPLKYPLDSCEHVFEDSDVIVREDEPSSIIAFCLNTSDYRAKLNMAANETSMAPPSQSNIDANTGMPNVNADNAAANNKVFEGDSNIGNSNVLLAENYERIMLKKGFHLKYQFEEGESTISCKIFFAEQFEAFRRQCGVDSNFIQSLSRCVKWDSTGGKSGSAFLKTLDDRFIIKELSRVELEAFVQMAPSYFSYFVQALFHGLPTVLVKIFGFYQIQVQNSTSSSKSYTLDVLIMENLFYDRKTSRIFDLKGSMRNRHVEQTGKENEVLLDENMVEYIYESPLFVRENAKKVLRASLWNDTLFLAKMNVMDYSLVIGIDSDNQELVVGIIDCVRTFTWDKKLESWVKEKGLVGGTGVGKAPTVVTPRQYKNRFREAMERYILMAPGPWYQGDE
ncbi:hypothetical protein B5S33_g4017 [[Candida] boidinii]|nr:hypothetical protein B5S33_g4017 [[Candida] boidinii]